MSFEARWNLRQIESGVLEGEALGEVIRRGALAIQEEHGLAEDGLCGPATLAAIEPESIVRSGSLEIPANNRADIARVYGTFDYQESEDQRGAIIIDRDWVRENIVKVVFHTGKHTWCHKDIADEMKALYQEACEKSGYTPKSAWSWVARHQRWDPKRPLSLHSWGCCIDFDPKLNGVGPVENSKLYQHPEFVEVFENAGWTWGGRWSRYPDAMHFQRTK